MMQWARDFRLIPLVLVATVSLFALKVSGLVFDGGYTLGERLQDRNRTELKIVSADSVPAVTPIITAEQPGARRSWAQEVFNYPDPARDITGSVPKSETPPPAAKPASKTAEPPPKDPGGLVVNTDASKLAPAGERAILERLQERRAEIEARARDIEMRESLLKAAEKRVEARVAELKALEAQVSGAMDTRDKAEAERFKNIVTMYESMKPKEAARIFDRLDMKVLVQVSTKIKPNKMAEILAQMSPEAAERLTVDLANRNSGDKAKGTEALPKIDGRQSGT